MIRKPDDMQKIGNDISSLKASLDILRVCLQQKVVNSPDGISTTSVDHILTRLVYFSITLTYLGIVHK